MVGLLRKFLTLSLFLHFLTQFIDFKVAYSFQSGILNCDNRASINSICTINLEDIRPTQVAIGQLEIQSRIKTIQEKLNQGGHIDELKLKEPEPTVLGPDHQVFIVDHHHFAVALLDLGEKQSVAKVIANYSDLSWDEFWKKMLKNKWVYLYDEKGKAVSIDQIPQRLTQLTNDPYRSLAWLVRIHQGYQKTDIPFADFEWANYFRNKVKLPIDSTTYADKKGWDSALKNALALSQSSKASLLPGYNGN